jgi:hypothetical protein
MATLGDINKKKKVDFNPLGASTQMFTNFADDLQTKGMVESEAGNQVFSPSQFVVEGVKTLGGMLPNSTGLEGMVNPNIKSPTAMAERATLGGFDVTTAGGTPTQKKQGGAGMSGAGGNLSGLADYAENAANNILGTKPATALPSLGSVDITKKPGIDPTNAPGLGVDGNTMTYRSPTGGKATITGPGVGSMNFDKARIDAGVPTIGDWAGQEAKNSIHQQGIARLRAGLPYDAKEAAVVQNQMNAARARDIADNNFGIAQRQQTEQASRIAQDLKNEASWMTRGSNVGSRQRKEAAELYAAAAGIESGTLKEGMQNRNVRELGLGEIDQRSQDSQRDYDAALAGQQITAQDAWLKNMLAQGNADRNYGLEKEKLGTERDKAGLTMQDKQAENLNRAQKLRLEAADKVTGIWANSNITNPQDKRRMAVGLYQQSGMSPKEAQFEAIQLDPEARAAIEAKDWNLMSRMYDADVVDAVRTQLEKRQLGYPQK